MNIGDADLYFGPTHQPVGFTNSALAQYDGSAEPIVRELIQNSIDAAYHANKEVADVRFIITEVPSTELPGWSTYKNVLHQALQYRKIWHSGHPSHDEEMITSRMKRVSEQELIPLLLCIDNGCGLSGKRMDRLLTPGNTDKGEGGAGSYGLGHHAAFGASNLRYVLYASQNRNKSGSIESVNSGHAILASHGTGKPICAADGYWFSSGSEEYAFDGSCESYPDTPPLLLSDYLNSKQTGTVVCMVGFNDFNRNKSDPTSVESICRVAASNFSDAIHNEQLTITVRDKRDNTVASVTPSDLGKILGPHSHNKRASKQGQINGEIAFNAWKTISYGLKIRGASEQIRWRRLEGSEQLRTRVHLFRKGMWITSMAPGLQANNFSDVWPFDAVLSLEDGPLERLVRNAEGPEHRGIDRKRLNREDQKQLNELIAQVANHLRVAVGERDDTTEFIPAGFAIVAGHQIQRAERIRRPRTRAGGGNKQDNVNVGEKEGDSDSKRKTPRRRGTPQPGSTPRYRTALRLDGTSVIEALIEYDEEIGKQSEIGIRVRAVSGADGTCEKPLPDTYLELVSVSDHERGINNTASDSGNDLELTLPAVSGSRTIKVELASPTTNPHLLELDIVKRTPKNDKELPTGEDS